MNYVGIDIHKKYSVLCAQDERGRTLRESRIEGNSTDGFVQFFQGLEGPSKAVLEACWNCEQAVGVSPCIRAAFNVTFNLATYARTDPRNTRNIPYICTD